jgi:hypothetical protein
MLKSSEEIGVRECGERGARGLPSQRSVPGIAKFRSLAGILRSVESQNFPLGDFCLAWPPHSRIGRFGSS